MATVSSVENRTAGRRDGTECARPRLRDRSIVDTPEKGIAVNVGRGDTVHVGPKPHEAARPMRVVVADNGCAWLHDADVDENKDLDWQGCWRCAEISALLDAGGSDG